MHLPINYNPEVIANWTSDKLKVKQITRLP